jgi:hypothetical protein
MVVTLQPRVAIVELRSECERIDFMATRCSKQTTSKTTNLRLVDLWSVLLPAFDDAAHAGGNHEQDGPRRVPVNRYFYIFAVDDSDARNRAVRTPAEELSCTLAEEGERLMCFVGKRIETFEVRFAKPYSAGHNY